MNVQPSTRRRTLATLATLVAATLASLGITVAAAAPASASDVGECSLYDSDWACSIIYNDGTVPIGVFNNWDREVPGERGTDDWDNYIRRHGDTPSVIWDYWSTHKDPDGMTAKLLPVHASSQSLGAKFRDSDGFYIGPGMRALVDVGSASHTCMIGPAYYRVHGYWPTVHVYSGPSVC